MALDRRTITELAVAGGSVLVFVGAVYYVSREYAAPNSGENATSPTIQPEGGLALVGAVVLFLLLMAGVGVYMYRQEFDED